MSTAKAESESTSGELKPLSLHFTCQSQNAELRGGWQRGAGDQPEVGRQRLLVGKVRGVCEGLGPVDDGGVQTVSAFPAQD